MIVRGSCVPSSIPRRFDSEPAATLRTTTSIGMISTCRMSCSRMLRRRMKWVGTPIVCSDVKICSEMRLLSTPLPLIVPRFSGESVDADALLLAFPRSREFDAVEHSEGIAYGTPELKEGSGQRRVQ